MSYWFEKHLNITLLIMWLMVYPLTIAITYAEALGWLSDAFILALFFVYAVIVYIVWWWVLSKKGRSHWFMLLLGVGLIITFFLDNKREMISSG